MVPDKSPVALILLDVINDLEWEGGEKLLPFALEMAPKLAALVRRAREARIPVVYVNDNYGRWQSDFAKLIEHCLNDDVRGKPVVEQLKPAAEDYFVLKPKHSGFFSTTLDVLLDYLGAKRLIITGIAGNICVLFTANDAYMRDFELYVPADCTCSNTVEINDMAVEQIRTVLKADIADSVNLDLGRLTTSPAVEPLTPQPSTPEFSRTRDRK
jgi:nicotinamidase-related amidase